MAPRQETLFLFPGLGVSSTKFSRPSSGGISKKCTLDDAWSTDGGKGKNSWDSDWQLLGNKWHNIGEEKSLQKYVDYVVKICLYNQSQHGGKTQAYNWIIMDDVVIILDRTKTDKNGTRMVLWGKYPLLSIRRLGNSK